jgi:hypothetical protein
MAESPSPPAVAQPQDNALSAIESAMQAAQASLSGPEPPTVAPPAEPAPVSPAPREPSTPDQAAEPETEAQEQAAEGQSAEPGEQTFSRKDAKRFYERAQKAESSLADLQRQMAETNAARQQVLHKWGARLGSAEERQQLEATVADPNTDWQELQRARNRLNEIRTASRELAPLYEAVRADVHLMFSDGIKALDTLPGVDGQAIEKLFAAKSGPEALKLMHSFATDAAKAEYEDQIAALKTQIKDLQTRTAAHSPQPASGNGASTQTGALSDLVGPDGLPTDKAIDMAKNGLFANLGAPR